VVVVVASVVVTSVVVVVSSIVVSVISTVVVEVSVVIFWPEQINFVSSWTWLLISSIRPIFYIFNDKYQYDF
jgi:hypothetical protein